MPRLFLTSLAAVALACASKPTPVNVTGDAADKASLAGRWAGEYQSATTGRSGSIVFNLSSTGETANGDVVMIPRGYGSLNRTTRPASKQSNEHQRYQRAGTEHEQLRRC
jgi:hypothetical protein